jgi:hypothetical protein
VHRSCRKEREGGVAIEIVSINLLLVVEMSTRAISYCAYGHTCVCVCGLCLCGAFIELVRYMYDGLMTAEK